jgi:uncharacterized protein YjiS (DUF1127 family)
MSCITIDSRAHRNRIVDTQNDGEEGIVARSLRAAVDLASARRNRAALAMMSERELDDLGLLPWEVRSEDRQKESVAATHCLTA